MWTAGKEQRTKVNAQRIGQMTYSQQTAGEHALASGNLSGPFLQSWTQSQDMLA